MKTDEVDSLVTGGTGLIGRWLLAALTRDRTVAAIVRNARARGSELAAFVDAHGGDAGRLVVVEGDIEAADLGLREDFPSVRDVFHVAARFAFGLDAEEARRCNVEGSLRVAEWARSRRALRRFVFVGGYRMTAADHPLAGEAYPLGEATRARLYRHHGAYEASKHESFVALRDFAERHGMAWTAVHPSSVIGDSRTGETTQVTGLGDLVGQLWNGRLPALVGTPRTFVPVVTVDYLARFLATVPERVETRDRDLCVLDPSTPNLPELVRSIAEHLHVPAPRWNLPVGLVRALPRALTGIEPESLRFLTEERYDTRTAEAHAAAVGLCHPPIEQSLRRWCDHLVATRFGADRQAPRGSFRDGTYVVGDPTTADVVFLHGLPFNGDAWRPVGDRLTATHARVDLPGLGRSAPSPLDDATWLHRLLAARTRPVVLVGHSLGAAMAVRYAHANPEKIASLVLVSPAFLQEAAPIRLRLSPVVAFALGRSTPARLGRRVLPELADSGRDEAVRSACVDLARRGVSSRAARALAKASRRHVRARLVQQLQEVTTPVLIVHGSKDALVTIPEGRAIREIEGAGHNPHMTHPDEVAALIEPRS